MSDDLQAYQNTTFESIKQLDEHGNELWSARQLAPLLGYKEWRYFTSVVDKAKAACAQSGNPVDNHFGASTHMVGAEKFAARKRKHSPTRKAHQNQQEKATHTQTLAVSASANAKIKKKNNL